MQRTTIVAAALAAFIAAPAFADSTSPAERFGALHVGTSTSPAATDMAVEKLSGDDLEDRIVMADPEVATRGVSLGDQQLANAMGVNVNNYTTAELAAMFIGKYD